MGLIGSKAALVDEEETKTDKLGVEEENTGGILGHLVTIINQGDGGEGGIPTTWVLALVAIAIFALFFLFIYCVLKGFGCFSKWKCCKSSASSGKDPEQPYVETPTAKLDENTSALLKILVEERQEAKLKAKEQTAVQELLAAKEEAEAAKAAQKRAEEMVAAQAAETKKYQDNLRAMQEENMRVARKVKKIPPPRPPCPRIDTFQRTQAEIAQQEAIAREQVETELANARERQQAEDRERERAQRELEEARERQQEEDREKERAQREQEVAREREKAQADIERLEARSLLRKAEAERDAAQAAFAEMEKRHAQELETRYQSQGFLASAPPEENDSIYENLTPPPRPPKKGQYASQIYPNINQLAAVEPPRNGALESPGNSSNPISELASAITASINEAKNNSEPAKRPKTRGQSRGRANKGKKTPG